MQYLINMIIPEKHVYCLGLQMTRFSVKVAESESEELKEILPAINTNDDIAKTSDTTTSGMEDNEPPVTLRFPKSALFDSSLVKDDDSLPKEVRFNIEQQRKSLLKGLCS